VICSDKTGILTINQMSASKLVAIGSSAYSLRDYTVDGNIYDPWDGRIQDWPEGDVDANLQSIAKIAALCNDAGIAFTGQQYCSIGILTEAVLKGIR